MQNEQFEHQSAANAMENEKFELANFPETAASRSKTQIARKIDRTGISKTNHNRKKICPNHSRSLPIYCLHTPYLLSPQALTHLPSWTIKADDKWQVGGGELGGWREKIEKSGIGHWTPETQLHCCHTAMGVERLPKIQSFLQVQWTYLRLARNVAGRFNQLSQAIYIISELVYMAFHTRHTRKHKHSRNTAHNFADALSSFCGQII